MKPGMSKQYDIAFRAYSTWRAKDEAYKRIGEGYPHDVIHAYNDFKSELAKLDPKERAVLQQEVSGK
jgi:hypothetical protein